MRPLSYKIKSHRDAIGGKTMEVHEDATVVSLYSQ